MLPAACAKVREVKAIVIDLKMEAAMRRHILAIMHGPTKCGVVQDKIIGEMRVLAAVIYNHERGANWAS